MSNVLIQIGYPKTGSTYLQEWFRQHPAILYQGKSVAGFYDSWEIERYVQEPGNQHQYFAIKLSAIGVRGGNVHRMISSDFADNRIREYQQNLSVTLHRLFPGGKVLIVTRGFASMLSSLYTEYIVSGGTLPFDRFYAQYQKGILKAYDYDALVTTFRSVFGTENVIVLPYELLRDNPARYTELIAERLGIADRFYLPEARINASPDKKYLKANLKLSNLAYKAIRPFPAAWQRRLYGVYTGMLNKKKNHGLVRRIASFLKEGVEVEVTAEMLEAFKGMGEALKSEPLYGNYSRDYLLD